MVDLLEIISTFGTVLGVGLLALQYYKSGWIINGAADIGWAYFGFLLERYWLMGLQVFLFVMACIGLYLVMKHERHYPY